MCTTSTARQGPHSSVKRRTWGMRKCMSDQSSMRSFCGGNKQARLRMCWAIVVELRPNENCKP